MKTAKGWMVCAENDFTACITLYEEQQYAMAVMHFAQASEKLAKLLTLLEPHDWVYLKTHKGIDVLHDFHFKGPNALDKYRRTADEIKASIEENEGRTARMPKQEIEELIDGIDPLLPKGVEVMRREFPEDDDLKIPDDELKAIIRITMLAYILSMISSPHYLSCRYPDQDLKPWEYDEELGIVAALPRLLKEMAYVIAILKKGYFSEG